MWLLSSQPNRRVDLKEIQVLIRAGHGADIWAWPANRGHVPRRESLSVCADGCQLLTGLEIAESDSNAWRLTQHPSEECFQTDGKALAVLQRRVSETFGDTVRRWLRLHALPSPDSKTGANEHLDMALPIGGVLIQPAGGDAEYRRQLIHSLVGERSGSFAGLYAVPSGGWAWYAHTPGPGDVNWCCILRSDVWTPIVAPSSCAPFGTGWRWVRRELSLNAEEQARWIQRIGGTPLKLCGEPHDRLPFRPMTVRWGERGQYLFGGAICFRFLFEPARDPVNTVIDLGLTECRPIIRPTVGSPFLVLAQFVEWVGQDQPYVMRVRPPTSTDTDLPPGFPSWKLYGDGASDGLTVAMLTPGFVRPRHSALSVLMKTGDWVVVELRNGQLPLVLGSLQRCRENQAQEVRLAGESLGMATVDGSGNPAGASASLVGDEGIRIQSAEVLSAEAPDIKLKADLFDLVGKASIKGSLDVTD